jgi:uncharacterized protein YdbL (DUF1318 family)
VSFLFFNASQKEHRLSTISFCYGKDMWLQTDGQAKVAYMHLQTNATASALTKEISLKLKFRHVKVAKVSSNVSQRQQQQLFKGKLMNRVLRLIYRREIKGYG